MLGAPVPFQCLINEDKCDTLTECLTAGRGAALGARRDAALVVLLSLRFPARAISHHGQIFTAEFPVYLSHSPGYLFCQALRGIHFIPENLLFMASSLLSSPLVGWPSRCCTVILSSLFAAFGGAFSSPVTAE